MYLRSAKIAICFVLAAAIGLAIMQGCGQLYGDYYPNQPPIVEIVNVPLDAAGTSLTRHYGMPFTIPALDSAIAILNIEGAVMEPDSLPIEVYRFIADTTINGIDTTIVNTKITYIGNGVDYTIDDVAGTLTAHTGGEIIADTSLTYLIDFAFSIDNYYVFSYAPTIHWSGYDPDGFIDHYSYADVYDTTFVNGFKAELDQSGGNPEAYFAAHQNEFTWVDTTSMQARIYLLTAGDEITEHIFFLRAFDNNDPPAVSQGLVFKTYFRSNQKPNNPMIKPMEESDEAFALNYVVTDTLFCLDELASPWAGISFNWTASDPDDKELYKIPLEYTYYLVKTPNDTIENWCNSDWAEIQQIQLFGLNDGSYTFSVWVRDDGLTPCEEPATIKFTTVRPTFEYHILIVDESQNFTNTNQPYELKPKNAAFDLYMDILGNLEGQLEYDNFTMNGVDVRVLDRSVETNYINSPIPYNLIGKYKLVLILDDDRSATNADYIVNRNTVLKDYLDIGGRVWIEGRRLFTSYGYATSYPDSTINIMSSAGTSPRILADYFQLEMGFATDYIQYVALQVVPEFQAALPSVSGFPLLAVDSAKVGMINNVQDSTVLIDVDWFTRADEATTLYNYKSVTSDTSRPEGTPFVYDDTCTVLPNASPMQCTVIPSHDKLLQIYSVVNVTKGVVGGIVNFNSEQITVSYSFGEPWDPADTVIADYKYDPISDFHLKPVAVRYEDQVRVVSQVDIGGVTVTQISYRLGYRTSLFTFPLFFMNNDEGQVEEVFKQMLNWFFYPTIHWNL